MEEECMLQGDKHVLITPVVADHTQRWFQSTHELAVLNDPQQPGGFSQGGASK